MSSTNVLASTFWRQLNNLSFIGLLLEGLQGQAFFTMITVRKTFQPYSHQRLITLHKKMQRDFGRVNQQWGFKHPVLDLNYDVDNAWILDYWFDNDHDATIFGLKYQAEFVD
jgi:hypothetical protein